MKVRCKRCNREVEVPITEKQLESWIKSGDYIQTYFPHLSAAEREMFVSGICNDCWNELFPEENEE